MVDGILKHLINVESLFCDSGFSEKEAIFCNIHGKEYGDMAYGINKIVIEGINDITLLKGEAYNIGMQFNKSFDKPTTCTISEEKSLKILECVSK